MSQLVGRRCFLPRSINQSITTRRKIFTKRTLFLVRGEGQCYGGMRRMTPHILPVNCYSKFIAARDHQHSTGGFGYPLDDDKAYDVVLSLDQTERTALKVALAKFESAAVKEKLEGELAANRWRSKFGRPARLPALGEVDPTGSYCAMPEDWLKKKAEENAKQPESKDLWKLFFVNAVPFVGFGFLDNFTMIIAGDYIEYAFGSFMCLSTMAAAGLGNTISDVLGIGSAFYIERGCEILGLRPPKLTIIQMEMKSSRRYANLGRIIGITVGCLIGMFPLLFMDTKSSKEVAANNENEETKKALIVST